MLKKKGWKTLLLLPPSTVYIIRGSHFFVKIYYFNFPAFFPKLALLHISICFYKQHHCRACGQVFCGDCSSKSSTIPKFGIEREVRVCDHCYEEINKWVHIYISIFVSKFYMHDFLKKIFSMLFNNLIKFGKVL